MRGSEGLRLLHELLWDGHHEGQALHAREEVALHDRVIRPGQALRWLPLENVLHRLHETPQETGQGHVLRKELTAEAYPSEDGRNYGQ